MQAERINRIRNLGGGRWNKIEQGAEDIRGQPTSYSASHGVRSKERYTEIEKDKRPEAKDRWDNLR